MLIGDKQQFAIQFELDEPHGGSWFFGRFCYWAGGNQIGDYSQKTSLRDVVNQAAYLRSDQGNRHAEHLCMLSSEEAFQRIDNQLLNSPQTDFVDKKEVIESPARFDIRIHVDVFDEWVIYLFGCVQSERLLAKNVANGVTAFLSFPIGTVDAVIKEAFVELEKVVG